MNTWSGSLFSPFVFRKLSKLLRSLPSNRTIGSPCAGTYEFSAADAWDEQIASPSVAMIAVSRMRRELRSILCSQTAENSTNLLADTRRASYIISRHANLLFTAVLVFQRLQQQY